MTHSCTLKPLRDFGKICVSLGALRKGKYTLETIGKSFVLSIFLNIAPVYTNNLFYYLFCVHLEINNLPQTIELRGLFFSVAMITDRITYHKVTI